MRSFLAIILGLASVTLNPAWADMEAGLLAFETGELEVAADHFLPEAKAGKTEAMTYLARTLVLQEQPAAALPWLQKAAQAGHAEAQTELARLYDAGEGVARDEDLARQWYGKAAAQGDDDAQFALGLQAEEELDDSQQARQWYEKAAVQGHAEAQYRWALLLLDKNQGVRDAAAAWLLLQQAAASAHEEAMLALDVLELEMSAAERRRAHALQQASQGR